MVARPESMPRPWRLSAATAIVATAVSALKAHDEHHTPRDSQSVFKDELPTFADIHHDEGNVVGFTTVYYDNFLSACRCETTAKLVHDRLVNMELPASHASGEGVGLRIKAGSYRYLTPDDMQDEARCLCYLGVSWHLTQPRRGDSCPWKLRWRICDEKIALLRTVIDPLDVGSDKHATWRLVAGIIGKILHHAILQLVPLGYQHNIPEIIEILRKCAAQVAQPGASRDATAFDEAARTLREAWAKYGVVIWPSR
jgi:hypothetical protein